MSTQPWQQASLTDMLASVPLGETDPWAEWVGMPEFVREDLNSYDQVIVHFACEDDLREFEQIIGQRIPNRSKVSKSIWYPAADVLTNNGLAYVSDES